MITLYRPFHPPALSYSAPVYSRPPVTRRARGVIYCIAPITIRTMPDKPARKRGRQWGLPVGLALGALAGLALVCVMLNAAAH